ncbi:MAG: carboxymuconolactone decarboxylase family protein [Acidimicrobiales bacterium]|nr:carboxymuconolactone decarboxylase family protein [Acidimicrobiales bacterium]
MTRLPYLQRDVLGDEGLRLWDSIVSSRGGQVVTEAGGLSGPFNPWLYSAALGNKMVAVGTDLRFGSTVERRLVEVAIITVGAHWKAEFEWFAHSRMALEHGVSPETVDSIATGTIKSDKADERLVHAVATRLMTQGRLDSDLYADAVSLLGEQGLVELVCLCGYYTIVSLTLNAFEVGLPDGVEPRWG